METTRWCEPKAAVPFPVRTLKTRGITEFKWLRWFERNDVWLHVYGNLQAIRKQWIEIGFPNKYYMDGVFETGKCFAQIKMSYGKVSRSRGMIATEGFRKNEVIIESDGNI